MKIKTADLIGPALDWAVAKCEGWEEWDDGMFFGKSGEYDALALETYAPSTNWAQGGPIIEREKITVCWEGTTWVGSLYLDHDRRWGGNKVGPTPLIAAMRCYVASKLGNEVEVPEELIK